MHPPVGENIKAKKRQKKKKKKKEKKENQHSHLGSKRILIPRLCACSLPNFCIYDEKREKNWGKYIVKQKREKFKN
jgi:hypothetical protein